MSVINEQPIGSWGNLLTTNKRTNKSKIMRSSRFCIKFTSAHCGNQDQVIEMMSDNNHFYLSKHSGLQFGGESKYPSKQEQTGLLPSGLHSLLGPHGFG